MQKNPPKDFFTYKDIKIREKERVWNTASTPLSLIQKARLHHL